jgi:hypothetical protein
MTKISKAAEKAIRNEQSKGADYWSPSSIGPGKSVTIRLLPLRDNKEAGVVFRRTAKFFLNNFGIGNGVVYEPQQHPAGRARSHAS